MTTMVVTGGTGTLGSAVTGRLRERGHEVRVVSRHSEPYSVDMLEGTGLEAALAGAEVVVHCVSLQRGEERVARNLVGAMRRTGVGHLVLISIVGVDRVPMGYYRSKVATEKVVEESGLGWTILRATQFHDLIASLLHALARLPVVLVPAGVSDQPVEVSEVAERLAELATRPPAGRVPDMGGPEVLSFRRLARAYLAATGRRRPVVEVRLAGKAYRGLREGAQLSPGQAAGKLTFGEYLERRFGSGV